MTHEQETALHDFEALVRQLMRAYREECGMNASLRGELAESRRHHEEAVQELEKLKHDYAVLKTARMIEVSSGDVKESRARLARLIREVDKCIALLNV